MDAMIGHPAQPFTENELDVPAMLAEQIDTLESIRMTLRTSRPTRKRKNELMAHISGVLGRLETIRLALK